MINKGKYVIMFVIVCFLFCQSEVLAVTIIGQDVSQSLPINAGMETSTEASYINNQLTSINGNAALTQDCKEGKYGTEVTVGNHPTIEYYSYTLVSCNSFDISEYNQIKLWIKPGTGAKWLRFLTGSTLTQINCDKNSDGKFEIGQDLVSGQWNLVTLDLTKTKNAITQAVDLRVETNEYSTWVFDEIKVVNARTYFLETTMVNEQTKLDGNNYVQFKTNSDSTFNVTPTVLMSNKSNSFNYTYSTDADFQKGSINYLSLSDANSLKLQKIQRAAAAGSDYSLAIKSDGTVSAWGFNYSGQLGDGTTTSRTTPVQVSSLTGVIAVAASGHSLALKTDGTVWAWGNNIYGQLGDGTTTNQTTRVQVTNLTGVTAIAAGLFHSLALKSDGTVMAWGTNNCGQLGDGTTITRFTPVQINNFACQIYLLNGNWVSDDIDLSIVKSVESTIIAWDYSFPNNTSITVETNLYANDQWQGWQVATNNGQIPGINPGDNLDNKKLKIRVILSTSDGLSSPQLNNIGLTITGSDITSTQELTGKITGISISSGYVNPSGTAVSIIDKKTIYAGVQPAKLGLSGDGNLLFYKNPSDSKLYLLNLLTGENDLFLNCIPSDFKVNFDGTKLAYRDMSNNLYYFRSGYDASPQLISTEVTSYSIQYDGSLYYVAGSIVYVFYSTSENAVSCGSTTVSKMDSAKVGKHLFASNAAQLYSIANTPAGWKSTLLTSLGNNIDALWSNSDGTRVFIKSNDSLYCFETSSMALRKLNTTVATVVKVTDDHKLLLQEPNYNYLIYDTDTDTTQNILPADAKSPGSATDIFFDADNTGNKMIYVANNGIALSYINGVRKPERYLLSFDSKNSWYTCQDGNWTLVKSNMVPVEEDFKKYGLTVDEVNALTEADFVTLYEGGREIYNVDAAIYFASTDPYTSPSLKGITVYVKQDGNDPDADLYGQALYTAKQQVFDGINWHQITRIYPIELSTKEAEIYYFVKHNDGLQDNYYTYSLVNNIWTWSQVPNCATYLSDVKTNWINITLDGMKAEQLRAIPSDKLKEFFIDQNHKVFSIVYAMKVLDESTKGYISKINIDYSVDLFSGTVHTLNIIFTNGTTKTYTNLDDKTVEDFMVWVNERQYNRGVVFYRIPNTNYFLNYYTIQSVAVDE